MNDPRVMSIVQKAHHLAGPEFAKHVHPMAQQSRDNLRRLQGASTPRKVREAQDLILKSHASRVVSLVLSVRKKPWVTREWLEETASTLNPHRDCGESIKVEVKPKSSGEGFRLICKFGPKRRALHHLVSDIIVAKFGLEPVDFLRKGLGADAASDHINKLVEEGYRYFILSDLKDYYPSVQHSSVREALGLPESVMLNCVTVGADVSLSFLGDFPNSTTIQTLEGAVRMGLPQGSRASSTIAGLLLGPVLREITSADRIIVHGDDSAVAARSMMEAGTLQKALQGVLESHPAGPFRLKRCEIADIDVGFEFMKYRHKRDFLTRRVHRRPAALSYWRYIQKVCDFVRADPTKHGVRRVAQYRRRWIQSFARWRLYPHSKLFLWITTRDAIKETMAEKAKAPEAPF